MRDETNNVGTRVLDTLYRFRFGLAAFLILLGIRTVPEILVGPYAVGWDTIAFYVPNTLDWAAGKPYKESLSFLYTGFRGDSDG